MEITFIYGSEHEGSTYRIAREAVDRMAGRSDTVNEFMLPRDFSHFCCGCGKCIYQNEEECPAAGELRPIAEAVIRSDALVIASPCYAYGMSGALKALFDHLCWLDVNHRPRAEMFSKAVLVVCTHFYSGRGGAAGDIKKCLTGWGISAIETVDLRITRKSWELIDNSARSRLIGKAAKAADRVKRKAGLAKPGMAVRRICRRSRAMQKMNGWNPQERVYWQERGWLISWPWKGDRRPASGARGADGGENSPPHMHPL